MYNGLCMNVKDIIKPATIISENDTFATALNAMINKQTNTLLVTDGEGKLSGEVTIANFFEAVVSDTLNGDEVIENFSTDEAFASSMEIAKELPVSEFMSRDFSALTVNDNLISIVGTAIAHQRARIPVVGKDNRPIGIISRQGLKKILAKFM